MRTYSLPEGLWLSFYSKPFYQAIRRQWRGLSLLYLFLVLGLTSAPVYVQMNKGLQAAVAPLREKLLAKIPVISIIKGEVHTPEAIPYTIPFGSAPSEIVVIDTTGKFTNLSDTPAIVLVTKKQAFFRKSPTETRIYDLSTVQDLRIDRDRLAHWLDLLQKWFPILFFPFVFALLYLKAFFTALLLALTGAFLLRWMEVDLDLAELLTLAIVALTPRLLMDLLTAASPEHARLQALLNIWLTVGYFLFALNAATDTPADE